jgi:ubiquinone/menaquinone biosynthesis C-methylase UbiE
MTNQSVSGEVTDANRARIERERSFWDEHARDAGITAPLESYRVTADDRCDRTVPWLPYLGMHVYIERLLLELGDVRGQTVLDLGTGTGFLTALLATRGATVRAVDVSDQSLAIAAARARVSSVSEAVSFHNMPAERLGFSDGSFDRVTGVFVLHHLDLARGLAEIHRVLRPGGVAVFIETWGRNRLLMTARRHLTGRFGIDKAGSPDEAPLGREAERILAESGFSETRYIFPDILFFRMLGYIPFARTRPVLAGLKALDGALSRFARLRQFSYFCLVVLRKKDAPSTGT